MNRPEDVSCAWEPGQDECICMTAADLGFSGWGDGVNPNLIANVHPECPLHGEDGVPTTEKGAE